MGNEIGKFKGDYLAIIPFIEYFTESGFIRLKFPKGFKSNGKIIMLLDQGKAEYDEYFCLSEAEGTIRDKAVRDWLYEVWFKLQNSGKKIPQKTKLTFLQNLNLIVLNSLNFRKN